MRSHSLCKYYLSPCNSGFLVDYLISSESELVHVRAFNTVPAEGLTKIQSAFRLCRVGPTTLAIRNDQTTFMNECSSPNLKRTSLSRHNFNLTSRIGL